MPNVFLTPHIAGVTADAEPRFVERMVDEVLRMLAGHRPRHRLRPPDPQLTRDSTTNGQEGA